MKPFLSFTVLLFLVLVARGSDASSDSCWGAVSMELSLAEAALPVDGVVVGELVFTNTSAETCGIGGNVSIDTHCGNLSYELVRPGGDTERLQYSTMADKIYFNYAELGPGDWVAVPVFLLKLRGEFIFSETGTYKIRASMKTIRPKLDTIGTSLDADVDAPGPSRRVSNWCEFRVTHSGPGHTEWKNSIPIRNAFRMFYHAKGAENLDQQASGFRAYRGEVEKYLIYQLHGESISRALRNPSLRSDETLARARTILTRAKKRGVGEAVWEWIVHELESTDEVDIHDRRVCNGYLFQ